MASAGKKQGRFHGRVEGHAQHCAHPGCDAAGEFRAPPAGGRRSGFDGPGDWRWLCLDHVREFNDRYNYFSGMSPDEIEEAQTPYGGWEQQTRAFSANGSPPPKWADFVDPLDAIGARFRTGDARARSRFSGEEQHALGVLGLKENTELHAVRKRYSELVRRYHPDRNGGDRSHESKLNAVIAAWQKLKGSKALA